MVANPVTLVNVDNEAEAECCAPLVTVKFEKRNEQIIAKLIFMCGKNQEVA